MIDHLAGRARIEQMNSVANEIEYGTLVFDSRASSVGSPQAVASSLFWRGGATAR
ncbi:MAG: hypothetical protein U1E76_02305 [Planctomycetota bacterium]